MKSLADSLPPEIGQQIHPEWRKNEADYWSARDGLLQQYQGQWIGFADGVVAVAASTPMEVFLAVQGLASLSWFSVIWKNRLIELAT